MQSINPINMLNWNFYWCIIKYRTNTTSIVSWFVTPNKTLAVGQSLAIISFNILIISRRWLLLYGGFLPAGTKSPHKILAYSICF